MERNMDKFDHQIKWSSDDPTGLLSGQQAAKSYTCNFCKRGFSNAQALGGHMNIHRRDRARIRQYSEDQQNQQQLSNSDNIHAALKINPISHHDDHELIGPDSEDKTTSFHHLEVNEPNIPRSKVAYPFSREDGDINVVDALGSNKGKVGAIQEIHDQVQLPLFLEEPSPANMIITENIINIIADHEKMKMTEELDLELRLGPEPPGTTSPTLSTRDFF